MNSVEKGPFKQLCSSPYCMSEIAQAQRDVECPLRFLNKQPPHRKAQHCRMGFGTNPRLQHKLTREWFQTHPTELTCIILVTVSSTPLQPYLLGKRKTPTTVRLWTRSISWLECQSLNNRRGLTLRWVSEVCGSPDDSMPRHDREK